MSKSVETTGATQSSLGRDVGNLAIYYLWRAAGWVRPHLRSRRILLLLAVAVLGAGAALNWSWLVAVGIAPILMALAPCAAMCALGLCMNKLGGGSCASNNGSSDANAPGATTKRDKEGV